MKAQGFGVPGTRCDGMDVLDVHASIREALKCARDMRKPQLVEAVTYRFRGHSMADPEEYRTKEQVEEWRKRDPIENFKDRCVDEGVLSDDDFKKLAEEAQHEVDEATEFADQSPFPDLDSLYDDIYVYGEQVKGWYSVDERSPEPHRGEEERDAGALAHELAEAGAAYAKVGSEHERSRRSAESEGEAADDDRDEEGGGD
jgi:2-oxoglutarate dehydrogenase complex dehydrogenase (E1) component-like enzyme